MEKPVFFKYLDRPKMLLGMQAIDGLTLISAAVAWVFMRHFLLLAIGAGAFILLRRKLRQTLPQFYLTGLCYLALPQWLFSELWRAPLPPSRKTLYVR